MAKKKKVSKASSDSTKKKTTKPKSTGAKAKVSTNLFPSSFWKQHGLPAALLFVLALGLYMYSVTFEYVLDDQVVYTNNNYVKEGFAGISKIMTTESFEGYFGEQKNLVEGGRYRPLSLVTFAMEYGLVGQNSKVSHFINVLLYGLTVVLFYRVLFLMFPAIKNDKRNWALTIPFITALLFTLHPIHTEVVANVKGRDEIMTLIGSLAAIYYTFKYIDTDKVIWLLASGFAFLLGLFSKENALTFVAIIPLTVYFFTNASFKKIAMTMLPLLLATVIFLWMRYDAIGFLFNSSKGVNETNLMNNPFAEMNMSEKYATIMYTLGVYVKLLFVPIQLTHDYYPYHIPIMKWSNPSVIISLLLYVVLGIFALIGLFRKNVFAYAILFFIITLSITSNLPFTIGTFMNERFIYVSSIGFCMAMAYLFTQKIPDWMGDKGRLVGMSLMGVMAIGFMAKTIMRVPAWKSPLSLNTAAIEVSKNSARANLFVGTANFEKYRVEKDRAKKEALLPKIAYHIDRALEIHPKYSSALDMKAGVYAEQYGFDKDLDKLLNGFYDVLTRKDRLDYIDQYMEYLNKRSSVDSVKLINWYYKTGTYFKDKRGNNQAAAKYFKMGLQVAPDNPTLKSALAMVGG